jgi:hypothetical protein
MCELCDCLPNVENNPNGDLKKVNGVESNHESCVICMDTITQDTNRMVLQCGHVFHSSCFCENVIQSNNKCPLCRTTICSQAPKIPNLTKQMTGKFMQQMFLGNNNNQEMYEFLKSISEIMGIELCEINSEDKLVIYRKIIRLLMAFGFNLGALIRQWIEEGNERYNDPIDDFNILVQISEMVQIEQ